MTSEGLAAYLLVPYGGNTLMQYAIAALIFAVSALIFMFIRTGILAYASSFAKGSRTLFDDALVAMVRAIQPPFYWFAAFVFALQYLTIDAYVIDIIHRVFIIWAVIQAVIAVQIFIDFIISEKIHAGDKAQHIMVSGILSGVIKIALWLLSILFVLSNFGINVTSLVAGLGIGGIAIALAAQNILGDLFSSLAIFFDRPFVIGDYIVVGSNSGTVQKIGMKTTRIRAFSGEEISIPNKDIAAARISNFKRMKERRATLSIAVPYTTNPKTLEDIPALLEASVADVKHAVFRSGFLVDMSPKAIIYELVFVVHDRDYDVYLAAKQQIILNIMRQFAKHRISLIQSA